MLKYGNGFCFVCKDVMIIGLISKVETLNMFSKRLSSKILSKKTKSTKRFKLNKSNITKCVYLLHNVGGKACTVSQCFDTIHFGSKSHKLCDHDTNKHALTKEWKYSHFTHNFFSNLKICLYHEIGFLISTPLHRAEIIHVSCKSKLRHEMHITPHR